MIILPCRLYPVPLSFKRIWRMSLIPANAHVTMSHGRVNDPEMWMRKVSPICALINMYDGQ